jgi:hypothetical protein
MTKRAFLGRDEERITRVPPAATAAQLPYWNTRLARMGRVWLSLTSTCFQYLVLSGFHLSSQFQLLSLKPYFGRALDGQIFWTLFNELRTLADSICISFVALFLGMNPARVFADSHGDDLATYRSQPLQQIFRSQTVRF